MTNFQNEVIALVSSFDVSFSVRTESYWFSKDVTIWIYINRSKSPEYYKCRRALRLTYGLKRLWDNSNFNIGDITERICLWVHDCP